MRRLALSLLAAASTLPFVSVSALAAAPAASGPADTASADPAGATGEAVNVVQGDIVVTAQKREQKLKDVPLTVSAVTQDRLNQLGVSELGEMAAFVPGLQIQKQSANNPGFVIRGITSDSGSAQAGSRVSVYYNGVDISRARGAWQDLFDMERIEVVKGPQATLFGTAAEVGAVSMISAHPRAGFSAGLNASYGNYNSTRMSGYVNAGNDTLAGRVAFSHKYRHGYTTNIQPGQDDLNGENDWGARASLRWTPTAAVKVDLVYTYDRQRDPGTGFTSLVYPTSQGASDPFGTTQLSGSPYSASALGAAKLGINRDVHDVNLTGTVQVAPGLTFTTVNGFRTFHSHEVFDADGSRAFYLEFAEDAQGEQYSHEGRFNYDSTHWRATFGWNAFVENSFQKVPFSTDEGTYLACAAISSFAAFQKVLSAYGVGTGTGCVNANGVATNAAGQTATYLLTGGKASSLPYTSSYMNKGVNKTFSVFGDVTFTPTPRLEITAGARFLLEHRKSEYSSVQPNSTILAAYGVNTSLLGVVSTNGGLLMADRNYHAVLPRVNVLYRLSPDVNLYATISEGRYSPVLQVTAKTATTANVLPIPAEKLWNYEAGIKGRIGPFSGALSAFYQVYSGFQVTVTTNGVTTTQSAGSAHNPGVEFEGNWQISPILSVNGMAAWLHGRIDGSNALSAYAGNHFRLQPDFSAALAVNLRVPLGQDRLFYFAPNWNTRSSVFFEMPNKAAISQGAYSLTNLRAGFELGPQGRYAVGGYVRNLFNRHYLLDAGNTGGSFGDPTYIAGEPRMYGIEASARF
ncbi:TonB-dependent receptor [Novosphingobium sp. SG720]|uniref:TonB-dependent receptor n=1 Tax=Novosphingobium sp. SG720 TaxID=2586998 RepID=UPI001447BBED|nr:TonB-dependent receptor [Novosphingobium sp. SG720]